MQNINALEINTKDDFGECFHTTSREPFYYKTTYKYNYVHSELAIDRTKRRIVSRDLIPYNDEWMSYESPIVVDENGKAHLSKQLDCSTACRTLDTKSVESILELIKSFDQPIEEGREDLDMVDTGCPYNHHVKI